MCVGEVSAQMLRRGCEESDKLVGFETLFIQPQSYKPFRRVLGEVLGQYVW